MSGGGHPISHGAIAIVQMIEDLAKTATITITAHVDAAGAQGWILTVTFSPTYFAHFHGFDLVRVIHAAWRGDPPGWVA